jgi:hypothetical protein
MKKAQFVTNLRYVVLESNQIHFFDEGFNCEKVRSSVQYRNVDNPNFIGFCGIPSPSMTTLATNSIESRNERKRGSRQELNEISAWTV